MMAKNYDSEWEEQAAAPSTPGTGNWKVFFKSDGLYIVDDAGTEYGPIQAGAAGEGEIFLPASAGWPSTTGGCAAPTQVEFVTNDVDVFVMDFDPATEEYAQWSVLMPSTWDAGTITFEAVWTAASGTGDVIWGLQGRAYADDDPADAAWGTAQEVTDTLLAADDFHFSPESSAITLAGTPAAGQWVQFRAYRKAADAGDTLGADARLLGLRVTYGKS